MNKKYKDIFAGSVVVLISIVIFISANYLEIPESVKVGPDFVPKLSAGLLAILGIILIIQGAGKLKEYNGEQDENKTKRGITLNYSLIATIVILIIYVALLEKIGFIIMTTLYLFIQIIILADKPQRKYVQFAIISVITSVSIYYIFVSIFRLMIPAGILG